MLKQADYSAETTLKNTLHSRLFGRQIVPFSANRKELSEDMLEMVAAAGSQKIVQPLWY